MDVLEAKLRALSDSDSEHESDNEEFVVPNPVTDTDIARVNEIIAQKDQVVEQKHQQKIKQHAKTLESVPADYKSEVPEVRERVYWSTEVRGHQTVDTFCSAFSHDCKLLALGCGDGSVRLLNREGRLAYFLKVPSRGLLPTTCVKFRPYSALAKSKNVLLVANSDGSLSHWHVQTQTCLFTIREDDNQIFGVDCAVGGRTFATCGREPFIRVYDEATKSLTVELKTGRGQNVPGHSSRVYCVKYDPTNDNVLYSGGWDNTVQMWDTRVGYAVRSIFGPHICGESLSVHPDGKSLLTGSYRPDNPLQIWDVGTGKVAHELGWNSYNDAPQMVYAASFSADGKFFAAGGTGAGYSEARLFDAETYKALDSVTLGENPVYSLAFDGAGTRLAVGGGVSKVAVMQL